MSVLESTLAHYGVELRNQRVTQLVRCPLDHESHPSCSIDLDKQLMNCHSCGFGGDAISLIMRKEEIGFEAAKRQLASIAGAGDESVRGRPGRGSGVPGQPSYRARFRRGVPARTRPNAGGWA